MPFAEIGDLRLYYEIHGETGASAGAAGEPLVLLNGALDTIEADWGAHLPSFGARCRVLADDHRGHGRTSASAQPFTSYDWLADDLAALLDALEIERAHFCGFNAK